MFIYVYSFQLNASEQNDFSTIFHFVKKYGIDFPKNLEMKLMKILFILTGLLEITFHHEWCLCSLPWLG
jgi:hypothetical protein